MTNNTNPPYIDALKTLVQELHITDRIAAYNIGSRANGYDTSGSDFDLAIVTKRSTGIRYIQTNDLPAPVNIGYIPQETLEHFPIRRRAGLPFRVVPIDNELYVTELASKTKLELTKRVASGYNRRAGNQPVPLLLPIAEHMVNQSRLEYWWTPKWIRAMSSKTTRDILEEEYTPVFQNLAEQGFFKSGNSYLVNPDQLVDDRINEGAFQLFAHGLSLLGIKLLLSVTRDAVKELPSRAQYRRVIKQVANDFVGVNYFV